jgi:hypothetical protein
LHQAALLAFATLSKELNMHRLDPTTLRAAAGAGLARASALHGLMSALAPTLRP